MTGRLVVSRLTRSADFERVLRSRSRASSAHFAVHHVPDRPSAVRKPIAKPGSAELSTAAVPVVAKAVDDLPLRGLWIGAVVPKRHARRAVTRTLLKRQIRSAWTDIEPSLAAGLWVIRLRAPFDRAQFVSAASDALKAAARSELRQLLTTAAQRV